MEYLDGEFINSQPMVVDDIDNNSMIKVYPYELINSNHKNAFVKQNATSIASISQDRLKSDENQLSIDENGNTYFEMLAAITSEGKLDISTSTSSIGQELKEEDSFICVSNFFFEKKLDETKNPVINAQKFLPVVFTIGEPFSQAKYENDQQAVFVASSIIEAKQGIASEYILDKEGLYSFNLINISAIASSFANCSILFSENDIASGNSINTMSLKMPSSGLLNKIQIKGKTNITDEFTDIDVKIVEGSVVLKGTPVETQDKLTMSMDWFDYDVAMPQYIASTFNTNSGIKLSQLKNVDFLKSGNTVPFFDDDQLHLLQDMVLVSYLFATSFSEPGYRYTVAEAKDIKGGVKPGDVKGELTVGNAGLSMVSISGKEAIKVVDSLYETYIRKHPREEGSTQLLAIKEIVAGISKYIATSYAIGNGNNSFNQIYLPWYIEPVNGIEVQSISNNNIKLSDNTRWKLNSKWFDLTGGTFRPIKNKSLSRVELIQTDRKLTIPKVGDVIQSIDKLPRPGDIDIKSSKDLMYYWHTPFHTEQELSFLMLGTPSSSTGSSPNVTFTTDYTRFGESIINHNDYVLRQASQKLQLPQSQLNVVSVGTLEQKSTRINSVRNINNGSRASYRGRDAIIRHSGPSANWTRNSASIQFLEFVAHTESSYRGYTVSIDDIEIVDMEVDFYHYYNDGFRFSDGSVYHLGSWDSRIHFKGGQPHEIRSSSRGLINVMIPKSFGVILKSERLANAVVHSNQPVVTYDIERNSLFDKAQWQRYTAAPQLINTTPLTLQFENNATVESISEVILSIVFADKVTLTINNFDYEIPLFNKDDETIGIQRILFT